ncbi:glycosyltransferase family 32 protein [Vibrio campbellii]
MDKIIHYCWFGPNEQSKLNLECQRTWPVYAPGAEIIEWNESNSPVDNPIVKMALQDKKWAFASDYVRLWAVHQHGGIYLDTDIELVKDISSLFEHDCFLGYQDDSLITNGVFGAKKGSSFVKACLERMENNYKKGVFEISPVITTETLNNSSFDEDIHVYPYAAFYPYKPNRDEISQLMFKDIKSNTFAIHHWEHSWKLTFIDRLKILSRKYVKIIFRKF